MMTNTIVFQDILHELDNDLEIEGKEYNLDSFYLNFKHERQETDQNQSQSQPILISEESIIKEKNFFFFDIPNYLSLSNITLQATFLSELCIYFKPINFKDLQQLCMLTLSNVYYSFT
ncbi:unnamed protein product [Adineta steineri]|uniref:Uncharacterized protein n=1 Tax=Adineta steineri TaxID=433720 RepID=A0A816C5E3_9BILA|nr:unnamed protein product [Adineta steineri]CAF1481684.1 unnamed protein product [Adineta steineri]CAF1618517.1 unnamed protein product [Adineta steineri]CAF1618572.1 unnamed protein product [Adineta steineri]